MFQINLCKETHNDINMLQTILNIMPWFCLGNVITCQHYFGYASNPVQIFQTTLSNFSQNTHNTTEWSKFIFRSSVSNAELNLLDKIKLETKITSYLQHLLQESLLNRSIIGKIKQLSWSRLSESFEMFKA